MNFFKSVLAILLITPSISALAGNKTMNVITKLTDGQGRLLVGPTIVTFRLYQDVNDPIGNAIWFESQQITIQNGILNVPLGTGRSLDSIPFNKPYYLGMQVAGDSHELQPRQLLSAVAYTAGSPTDFSVAKDLPVTRDTSVQQSLSVQGKAIAMGNIQAKTVTTQENITATNMTTEGALIAAGPLLINGQDIGKSLIPPGAIALFNVTNPATPCPTSWVLFTALNNYFPLAGGGRYAFGRTGGDETHTHAISYDGTHNHGGWTGATPHNNVSDSGDGSPTFSDHNHSISLDGNHNHGGSTGSTSNLPPYFTVAFCQKQ